MIGNALIEHMFSDFFVWTGRLNSELSMKLAHLVGAAEQR
jgi:hypothetical protein